MSEEFEPYSDWMPEDPGERRREDKAESRHNHIAYRLQENREKRWQHLALMSLATAFIIAVPLCITLGFMAKELASIRLEIQRIGNVNLTRSDSENGNLPFPRPEK